MVVQDISVYALQQIGFEKKYFAIISAIIREGFKLFNIMLRNRIADQKKIIFNKRRVKPRYLCYIIADID